METEKGCVFDNDLVRLLGICDFDLIILYREPVLGVSFYKDIQGEHTARKYSEKNKNYNFCYKSELEKDIANSSSKYLKDELTEKSIQEIKCVLLEIKLGI